jgi:hypothetical protein
VTDLDALGQGGAYVEKQERAGKAMIDSLFPGRKRGVGEATHDTCDAG